MRIKRELSKIKRKNAKLYPIYKMFSWDLLFFYSVEFLFYTKEKSTVENNAIEIFNRLKTKFIIDKNNLKNSMDFYIEDFDEAAEYEELSFKNNIENIENWIAGKI